MSGAVIAGFLLTAIPNWTGRLPVAGAAARAARRALACRPDSRWRFLRPTRRSRRRWWMQAFLCAHSLRSPGGRSSRAETGAIASVCRAADRARAWPMSGSMRSPWPIIADRGRSTRCSDRTRRVGRHRSADHHGRRPNRAQLHAQLAGRARGASRSPGSGFGIVRHSRAGGRASLSALAWVDRSARVSAATAALMAHRRSMHTGSCGWRDGAVWATIRRAARSDPARRICLAAPVALA